MSHIQSIFYDIKFLKQQLGDLQTLRLMQSGDLEFKVLDYASMKGTPALATSSAPSVTMHPTKFSGTGLVEEGAGLRDKSDHC